MKTVKYSEARQNLSKTMNEVVEDNSPILINRKSGKGDVVMMSLEDYNSIQETFYLLKSPKNAERLLTAIDDLESGKGLEKDLID